MKLLNLVFVHVLPYCELSFCHRDHCRVLNERFFPARLKSRLRFKKNVPSGLSNHGLIQLFQYWGGVKDVQKKTRSDVLQATFGGKISKFIRFATTDSIGVSFKSSCLRDLSCVTLKFVRKCLFENIGIGKECNRWALYLF